MTAGRRVRVLIVDDHPLFADSLKALLERDADLDVIGVAYDGEQAVDLAAGGDPDVVLMDITLPLIDGFEATRRIRRLRNAARVIGISGHDPTALAGQASDAGMVELLSKDKIGDHVRAAIARAYAR